MNITERLAVVETEIKNMAAEAQRREEVQKEMLESLKSLNDSVGEITSTINKYKGFVGGVLFILSALGVFISKFGTTLYSLISTGKWNG